MSMTNCPNCGSAKDPHVSVCPFCGTSYFYPKDEQNFDAIEITSLADTHRVFIKADDFYAKTMRIYAK